MKLNHESKRRVLLNILVLFISLFLSFLLAEALIRTTFPQQSYLRDFQPEIGFYNSPNKEGRFTSPFKEFDVRVKINSYGFNDKEYQLEKPNDTIRIIILGDSFVEATQVDLNNTFHKLLEKSLNTSLLRKVEVLSFGRGGASTCEEIQFFNSVAKKFNPDMVILATFAQNDIKDDSLLFRNDPSLYRCYINKSDELVVLKPKQDYERAKRTFRSLFRNSHFMRLIHSSFFEKKRQIGNCQPQSEFWIYFDKPPKEFRYGLKVTERLVTEFSESLNSQNIEFYWVLIPSIYQINYSKGDELRKECLEKGIAFRNDPLQIEDNLQEIARKQNLKFLRMSSIFHEEFEMGKQLYFPLDEHFTEQGHHLAERSIREMLMSKSHLLHQLNKENTSLKDKENRQKRD